jgi:multiple sugar transport system ATP-binding protein
VLAVVGPSGSGKTTLLRLLTGLLAPDTGTITIGGNDVTREPPERRPVAMVFQGLALFPHLSVRDNIGFGLRIRRTPGAVRRRRVDDVAAALRLSHLLDRLPNALSGGERQRTALGRALVRDPVLFCLDEPLASLDPVLRTETRREMRDILRADNRCAVYVTHDQSEAMTTGDQVAVLNAGRLEQTGTVRELYESPATSFVAGFVGDPPMSLLPAQGGVAGPLRSARFDAGDCVLGVRAEDVHLDPAGQPLRVLAVEDHGDEVRVVLDVAGNALVARAPLGASLQVGDEVGVRIEPGSVHVFDCETGRSLGAGRGQ